MMALVALVSTLVLAMPAPALAEGEDGPAAADAANADTSKRISIVERWVDAGHEDARPDGSLPIVQVRVNGSTFLSLTTYYASGTGGNGWFDINGADMREKEFSSGTAEVPRCFALEPPYDELTIGGTRDMDWSM